MYCLLNGDSPIIGMDYSYSDDQQKRISLYFKSKHSIVVDPSFLEVISMMNGMFKKEDIIKYAVKIHSFNKAYVDDVLSKLLSWHTVTEDSNICLWGSSFDKKYSIDLFRHINVRFLSVTPAFIDLSLLLCKYGFRSISFSDPKIRIKQEDVNSSVLLQNSDIGQLLCDLISFRVNRDSNENVFKDEADDKDCDNIYICDGFTRDLINQEDTVMDANDYRNNLVLCKGFAFSLINNSNQDNEVFFEFETMLKMESDIVFGVVDGFYS